MNQSSVVESFASGIGGNSSLQYSIFYRSNGMSAHSDTIALAKNLISRPSVTPKDEGCQALMIERLRRVGFAVEALTFADVTNFWAVHGSDGPMFCFAGHTDVVPSGEAAQWQSPPFQPEVRDGLLYGRGAADMKGSLAAMVVAAERFVTAYPEHPGRLAFLITSDEEGDAINGTAKVVEWLDNQQLIPDWCLVGEPSSSQRCADTLKIGRRGSLGCKLVVHGKQGHVAYPQLADNPIHRAMSALAELVDETWDEGNEAFPPTTLQISNLHSGTGANNVIPGSLEASFNIRFSTELTAQQIIDRTEAIFDRYAFDYDADWRTSGLPFLTNHGKLIAAATDSIVSITGQIPKLSTAGGTSDGRFIAPMGTEVVELGPINASIHQVDEHVRITDLDVLTEIYHAVIDKLLRTK
tara:strand:- start:6166 stop:7398 length:1233 start_codon:yes stop_codon:yes gene_type:complete